MTVKTEDIDALFDSLEKHNGPTCRISTLAGAPRAIYDRGVAMKRSATVIARALTQAGFPVTHSTILRHLAQECATCRTRS